MSFAGIAKFGKAVTLLVNREKIAKGLDFLEISVYDLIYKPEISK